MKKLFWEFHLHIFWNMVHVCGLIMYPSLPQWHVSWQELKLILVLECDIV